jgi:SAM-dependent methyltransferase
MMTLKTIKEVISREQFSPGLLGIFVNPFYFARKGLSFHVKSMSHLLQGKLLDVGCGQKPYEYLFDVTEYIGLEVDTPENRATKKAEYFYDGKIFPFQNEEFDSIIANQVFEHVFNPVGFLSEIHRVLKPNGLFLITVPFVWDEHEQPIDYARYSSFGIKQILENHGFEIVEQHKSIADVRVIFQLTAAYIYKKMVTQSGVLNLLFTFLFISPLNVIGEVLAIFLPDNEDLYLDNIVLAKKYGTHVD